LSLDGSLQDFVVFVLRTCRLKKKIKDMWTVVLFEIVGQLV